MGRVEIRPPIYNLTQQSSPVQSSPVQSSPVESTVCTPPPPLLHYVFVITDYVFVVKE